MAIEYLKKDFKGLFKIKERKIGDEVN